ncbi:MAG: NlpC/P60 family protein [Treponema sp.]|nr:NlpC/P60 family protein [Treponema sp.]
MYSWTQKYVGIPFLSNGRDFNGCDCYGLTRLILQNEYDITLPELDLYQNALNTKETSNLFKNFVPVICGTKIQQPEEKAVCLVRTTGGLLSHVGLYAGDGFIIHTRNKTGAVCERISSPFFTGRIEGWYHVNKTYNTVKSILDRT